MIRLYHTNPYIIYQHGLEITFREYPDIYHLGGQLEYTGLLVQLSELNPDV